MSLTDVVAVQQTRGRVEFKIGGECICKSCFQRQYPETAKKGLQMRTELLVIAEVERLSLTQHLQSFGTVPTTAAPN